MNLRTKRAVSEEGQEKIRLAGHRQFIKAANGRHGDRFDYSATLETFRTQKSPEVQIGCKVHQLKFTATPFNHIRSASGGCELCDKRQMNNFFLERERAKFEKFFIRNLSSRLEMRSTFCGMTNEMEFFCKTHGTSSRHKPTYLLNGGAFGCIECSRESTGAKSRLDPRKAVEELSAMLPGHIEVVSISFDELTRASLAHARCERHGEFTTTTAYLRKSIHKCPKCGSEYVGYAGHRLANLMADGSRGRPTFLGVMEVEVFGLTSLKVGVTARTLSERYKWNLKQIYFSVRLDEIDAYILENQIRRNFSLYQDLRIMKAGMRSGERWAGDTECYRFAAKKSILSFIEEFMSSKVHSLDYEHELTVYEVPNFQPRNVSRSKDERNKPIAILGVDPITNQVVRRFGSTSEASRAGYKNVSSILAEKYGRQLSGGLRWFKEKDFDPLQIPKLGNSYRGNPKRVLCIDTAEVFESIQIAGQTMNARGIKVSSSHISSVCKGKRMFAGGYRWQYVEPS